MEATVVFNENNINNIGPYWVLEDQHVSLLSNTLGLQASVGDA